MLGDPGRMEAEVLGCLDLFEGEAIAVCGWGVFEQAGEESELRSAYLSIGRLSVGGLRGHGSQLSAAAVSRVGVAGRLFAGAALTDSVAGRGIASSRVRV